jgi:hypothetical protein
MQEVSEGANVGCMNLYYQTELDDWNKLGSKG